MTGERNQIAFNDFIDLISGGTPKTNITEYWGGSIPWLSVVDFNTGYRWVSSAEKAITKRGFDESATNILNRGDIIISARGTVGALAQLAIPMAFNQSCYGIRGKKGIADTNFVYYALRHAVTQMQQVAHGGVFNTITRDTFKIIKTRLPSLNEQKAIACILGALDDKIELNRQMNKTLEEMARAIFKSWFVDFDPVHAKAAVRREHPDLPAPQNGAPRQAGWSNAQISRAALPNLKPEIAELFPDSFEDSELGRIPKGWEVGPLGNVADHVRRGIKPKEIKSDTPYIALEHMPRNCIALSDWGTADTLESNKYEFKKGEILFGKLRPYFHKVGVAPVNGVCSTDIVVVVGKSVKWFGFVLGHLSSTEFVEYTNAGSTGTKMPRTSWIEMAHYQLVLPPEPLASAFTVLIQPSIERIIANINESLTLSALRDTLLPKLISGELRIKDAERFLGRVL
jgi:type I restriction enzyme S subunit